MGHVYRKPGRKAWMLKYYRDGAPIYEGSGTEDRAEAERILRVREGEVASGTAVSPKFHRLRFPEAADDLLTDYENNARASYDELERRLRLHLRPYFRKMRLSEITTAVIRKYIAHRKTQVIVAGKGAERRERAPSNGEINRELTHLKRLFTLAYRAGTIARVPHIELLAEHNVRKGFFERPQLEAICRHLSRDLAPVARFAYLTGWRITSEVLPLTWGHIDFNAKVSPDQPTAGVVRLEPNETKNDDGREFALTSELREVLLEQRRRHQELKLQQVLCPWVFHRNYTKVKGKRITAFVKAWKIACRAAGLPGKLPHDFRRTAVRNLVRAGVPEKVAMRMTGHRTRSVFERYNIVSGGDLASASAALDRHHRQERASGDPHGDPAVSAAPDRAAK
jgi:integrase